MMEAMAAPCPASPWSLLASGWEELFPLRQPRLALALSLTAPGSACLDAGCATGSLPRALAAQGRLAQGLDLDPAFLAVAQDRALADGLTLPWHEASLLDLTAATGGARFQLITCLGQTLPHLLEEDQWLSFFSQARAALDPGGSLVIQAVHDGSQTAGQGRSLPRLQFSGGTLERRRTMLSPVLATFETRFQPLQGPPVTSHILHRRMAPGDAAALMRRADLSPEPPLADEAGHPFQATSAGWVLIGRRNTYCG